jgi:Protein of unknown function (DUF3309)
MYGFEAEDRAANLLSSTLCLCKSWLPQGVPARTIGPRVSLLKRSALMSIGLILIIVLVIFLLGGFSGRFGGYGYGFGHGGVGVIGIILIVLIILLLTGRL